MECQVPPKARYKKVKEDEPPSSTLEGPKTSLYFEVRS